jgi:hypothetical protein
MTKHAADRRADSPTRIRRATRRARIAEKRAFLA